jgi:hypothetical protein
MHERAQPSHEEDVDTHGLTPVALAKDYSLLAFGIHPRADARRPLQEFDRRGHTGGVPKCSLTGTRYAVPAVDA